jgi:hypothetical protein
MEKFDKKITDKILPKFNNAKEWSDLMTIIKNFKENLKKYSGFNMYNTTDKVLLAKRLAQSLNTSLPGGLHEISLEVYDTIFENIRQHQGGYLGVDLGLYSSGLFPFFQYATVPNKILFLNNIVKKHYIELQDSELALCLPGLLGSVLPGLDDQNETILKTIKEIFAKIRSKVGETFFFGTLWDLILRTQRLRLVGLKYLNEVIPLYKTIETQENPEAMEEYIKNYYPNLPVLVINSLTSVVEDENVLVQRWAMDFIMTRLPLNNKILNEDHKVSLVISALKLLIKNDYTTARRLEGWLMGGNQEEELEMGDPAIKYMIELVIKSIKKIFSIKNSTKDKLNNGIKIIDQLFKQQVKFVDYVLEFVAMDMINCVEHYWTTCSGNTETDEIMIKVKKFFEYDSTYLDCMWNSLGKLLHNAVSQSLTLKKEENKTPALQDNANQMEVEGNNDEDQQLNHIGEINSYEDINNAIKLLKLCLLHIHLDSIDKKNKFYIPIISSLLKALVNYNIEEREKLIEIKSVLVLALKFTKDLQDLPRKPNEIEGKASHKNSIKSILLQNEQNFSLLEGFKENIILFQSFFIEICKLLLDPANADISKHDMKIFKQSTELLIRIQEYSNQEK